MNEFIVGFINELPVNAVKDRSWFEIVSILAPSVLLIAGLFSLSFFINIKYLKKSIYILCLSFSLFFLPYELFRQATVISKADANINITQSSLKELLNSSNLDHIDQLTDKEVASETLEKLIFDLNKEQKQALLFVSWLISENEIKSNQLLGADIKLSLNNLKGEIINSRTPVDKISDDVLQRIDKEVTHLIEIKMKSFNQEIDHSLDIFQGGVNSFIQSQFQEYEQTLSLIMQKNIDELRSYSSQAKSAFARQVDKSNKESLQKLEDTKKSVDNVVADVKQLASSVEDIQKKNEILFKYNECLRSIGLIDFSGREEQCRKEMNKSIDDPN